MLAIVSDESVVFVESDSINTERERVVREGEIVGVQYLEDFSMYLCWRSFQFVSTSIKLCQRKRTEGKGRIVMKRRYIYGFFIRKPSFLTLTSNLVGELSFLVENISSNSILFFSKTPLHWAACNGHEDVVLLLLHGGADPTLANVRIERVLYEEGEDYWNRFWECLTCICLLFGRVVTLVIGRNGLTFLYFHYSAFLFWFLFILHILC